MNIIPMFLNVFVPWGVFVFCCGLTSFWLLYKEPNLVRLLLMLIFGMAVALLLVAGVVRKQSPEPTWLTYVAISVLVAAIAGTACGLTNYTAYTRPFCAINDLKSVYQVDAGRELGKNLMDAGIVYFAANNRLDIGRSWHFKQGSVFCVAPVITNGSAPTTHSYDFWAVGQDCCSTSTADFRCGPDWSNVATRSGIRVLDDDAVPYYRLAVKQAEALYGITSSYPVFFTWSQDPLAEVNSWRAQAFTNYVFFMVTAFCVFLIGVMLASCKYAWIGRAASAYDADVLSDPDYRAANVGRPIQAIGTRPPPTA
eukprot:SRR837773.1630.p1 GENE.SRR837773.1630~~SRR837773.1630.p1  ORF type:complete len:311 (-),score=79.90 SRR837773.1630:51-983(-)